MPGAGPGNLDALPGSEGTGPAGTGVAPAINGNALGQFILLQRGADDPLRHFHEALRRLDQGLDEDGKVRVLLYGASHTAADIYPTYLRAYLQKRFGDGGLGFYPLAKPSKYTRPFGCALDELARLEGRARPALGGAGRRLLRPAGRQRLGQQEARRDADLL